MYNNHIIDNSGFKCLFTFFHEIRADFREGIIDDVEVTCSTDYKTLGITLKAERWDGEYNTIIYTFINTYTWMELYEYIDVVKRFMNAYNKYSNNGTAEPKIKMQALRRAYNERVHRCGETW